MVKFIRHIFDVFGYSPFPDLLEHAKLCVTAIRRIQKIFKGGDTAELVREIDDVEKKADEIKDRIRRFISDPIVLPVDKYAVYNLVLLQDNIINLCRDLAVLLTIKELSIPSEVGDLFEKIAKIADEYSELYEHVKPLLAKAFVKSEVSQALEHVDTIVRIGEEFEKCYLKICQEVFESLKPAELVLLREVVIYFLRIVENFVNAAKMFRVMIKRGD